MLLENPLFYRLAMIDPKLDNPWTIQSIYDLQYFNCPTCPTKIQSKQKFVNHAYQTHPEAIDHLTTLSDGSLDDIECPWTEVKEEIFENEITEEPQWQCLDCEKVCESKEALKEHCSRTHPVLDQELIKDQVIKSEEVKVLVNPLEQCDQCDRYFQDKITLQDHIKHDHEGDHGDHELDHSDHDNDYEPQSDMSEEFGENESDEDFFDSSPQPSKKAKLTTYEKRDRTDIYCEICDRNLKTKNSLTQHYKNVHPGVEKPNIPCPRCLKKYYSSKQALILHLKTKHELKVTNETLEEMLEQKSNESVSCDVCGKSFTKETFLKKHVQRIHKIGMGQNYTYNCKFCEKKLGKPQSLMKHVLEHHQEVQKTFKCDCNSQLEIHSMSEMLTHAQNHHGEEFTEITPKIHQCELCFKDFQTVRIRQAHSYLEHGIVTYPCFTCDQDYSTSNCLASHQRIVHQGAKTTKTYKCAACNWKGKKYKTHWIETHPEVPMPYLCHICDFKSVMKWTLDVHISKNHEKSHMYQCDQCGYQTAWSGSLSKFFFCFGEKKWKNIVFFFTFSERHTNEVHLNIRNHHCDKCSKSFKNQKSLEMHLYSVHKAVLDDSTMERMQKWKSK